MNRYSPRAEDRFWIRFLHLFRGHLAISLVRNDTLHRAMRPHMKYRVTSFHAYERGLGWYLTIHIGPFFLNIDWV